MRHTLLLSLALAASASVAGAQAADTVTEPLTAAKRALVDELSRVADFRGQTVRTMRETSMRQNALPVPPGFWDRFIARAEQDVDSLVAPMLQDYARFYTSDELRTLIAFYKTPVGQHTVKVAPIMGANSSVYGQRWGQRVGMEIATELMAGGGAEPSTKPTSKPVKP